MVPEQEKRCVANVLVIFEDQTKDLSCPETIAGGSKVPDVSDGWMGGQGIGWVHSRRGESMTEGLLLICIDGTRL